MAEKDWDLIGVDAAEPMFGIQVGKIVLRTHGEASCRGPIGENGRPICCIHNPSDHHMVTWKQNWRGDKGMMERVCKHGCGHPDPDDLAVRTTEWAGVHGCDGCCRPPSVPADPCLTCPRVPDNIDAVEGACCDEDGSLVEPAVDNP